MRKVVVSFVGLVLLGTLFFSAAIFAAEKFAYVDLSRIFSEYAKTKEYDKALANKEQAYNTERNKKVNEIKQFQDKMNLMSDKEKEAKKADFETKIKGLQDFDRLQQADLRKEQTDKMKEVLKDIEAVVKQHAEKEGYTMVFNDRVLVYQAKNLDITEKVIEMLNKGSKR